MRRLFFVSLLVVVMALVAAGCGGSDEPAAEETPAAEPATEAPAGDTWTTVTTLRSTDPPNDMGILVSEPFEASGDVQLVLDMPGAGGMDGVISVIIPEAGTVELDAVTAAESIILSGAQESQIVSGFDGAYTLVVAVPAEKEWAIEVQTQE
jgi:ABC-type glycerol-3-phosphate transport system substrate-binding protein